MEQLKQLMSYIKEKPDARLRSYGNGGLRQTVMMTKLLNELFHKSCHHLIIKNDNFIKKNIFFRHSLK